MSDYTDRQHAKDREYAEAWEFIAAEQLRRRVYGMEISPAYCDVIVKRWLALGEDQRVIRNGKDMTEQFASVTNSTNPVSQS